jgi:arsenite methyltransferase
VKKTLDTRGGARDVIDRLRSTGLTVEHRQISEDPNAPHLLIAHAVA